MFYQKIINDYIDEVFLPTIELKEIKTISKYVLEGGKRYRSMIVLDISKTMFNEYFMDLALCVELIHNASLILDDLPCMDNDLIRRNKDSAHVKYGINNSKIVAQYFIMKSTEIIYSYVNDDNKIIVNFILEELQKACLGQYYDLNKNKDINTAYFINLKTGPFFSISFVIPFLKHPLKIGSNNLYVLSNYFSMAFQICDDLEDVETDGPDALNYVSIYGLSKSNKDYYENINNFTRKLQELSLYSKFFDFLVKKLNNKYIENGKSIQNTHIKS